MTQENYVERIVFRLARGEIAALLRLMDFAGLPGAAIEPAQPDASTVNALVEAGIIVLCEGRILLDRTMALILQSAAESQWFARAARRCSMWAKKCACC